MNLPKGDNLEDFEGANYEDGPEETCEKCGSKNLEYGEVPSMAGWGEDWWLKCLDCSYTVSGHPDVS